MREESNRIVQGLKETRAAEAQQAEINLRAMESDAAYTERITKENYEIEQQNLENEQEQIIADIKGEQKQAEIDVAATDTILNSLIDFSATLGEEAARRTDQMIIDQTDLGRLSVQAIDPQRLEEYIRAENASVDGSIMMAGEIVANDAEAGVDRLETIKSLAGIPGLSGYAAKGAMNELVRQLYGDTLQSRLTNSEVTYTSSAGVQYTGLQASRDVNLINDLQVQTEKEVLNFLGVTEPLQVRKGLSDIREYNKAIKDQTRTRNLEDEEEELRQKVAANYRTNTVDGFAQGFIVTRGAFGLKAAHDSLQELVADPNIDLEQIKKLKIDGKVWYENWSNRWEDGLAARNQAIVDNLKFERQLIEEEDKAWQRNSAASIEEAYKQNAIQASLLVERRYRKLQLPKPQWIQDLETSTFAKNKAVVRARFEELKGLSMLDLPFVNSIRDPTLQKEAREAYDQQQIKKYGPDAPEILKRLNQIARTLTNIDANEKVGGPGTYQVEVELRKFYIDALTRTNDAKAALNEVRAEVDAANRMDKNSRFFYETGPNNRRIFTKFQSSDPELAEMRVYIDQQMIKYDLGTLVDKPFAIANKNQLEATSLSSLTGFTQWSPGVIQVADRFGVSYFEVHNAAVEAANRATGSKIPKVKRTLPDEIVENAPAWMQKLFNSGEDAKVGRAVASAAGNLPRRDEQRTANEFINMAEISGAKFPKLVAAQMILESAGGTALSGTNNFFGIKATTAESSTAKQTTEFRDGVERAEVANFKNYSSPQESVDDLVSKWYKNYSNYQGVNNANSLEEAAMMLQQQGYATDPNYAQKLIKIANRLK